MECAGPRGRGVPGVTDVDAVAEIKAAYGAGAAAWATGPEFVYRRLADALVARAPADLAGRRTLDLGSGTGVATRALVATGAEPIGLDLALEMLVQERAARAPGVAGDARLLPFGDRSFDAVVAACCLNHLEPDAPLRECRRVLGDGGVLLASSFPSDRPHPAKEVIEAVLADHGWQPPSWYADFRQRVAAVTGDPGRLAAVARATGFGDVVTEILEVEAGVDDPQRVVAWRLNMPHTLGFVESLEPPARERLRADAVASVGNRHPSTVALLTLTARA